jgi:glycosyltransferase 2 family protein
VSSTETNAPTTENGIAAPRRASLASRIVKISFGVAVLVFGAVYIGTRWDGVRDALSHARPAWIVVAIICAAAGQWAAALSFGSVLRMVAPPLPILEVARVHFVSQLGKYIPGSVWPIVAITEMGRRYGIARRSAATVGVLALLYSLVVATVLGLVFVLAASAGSAAGWWWLVAVFPAWHRARPSASGRCGRRRRVAAAPPSTDRVGSALADTARMPRLVSVVLGTARTAMLGSRRRARR